MSSIGLFSSIWFIITMMIMINCYVLGQNSDEQNSMIIINDNSENKNVTKLNDFFKSLNFVIELSKKFRLKHCTNPAKNDDCQQILFDLNNHLRCTNYLENVDKYKYQQYNKLIHQIKDEIKIYNCEMDIEPLEDYHLYGIKIFLEFS